MFEDNYPEGLKRLFVIKGSVAHSASSGPSLYVCVFYHFYFWRIIHVIHINAAFVHYLRGSVCGEAVHEGHCFPNTNILHFVLTL